jgi:hypothetical protein
MKQIKGLAKYIIEVQRNVQRNGDPTLIKPLEEVIADYFKVHPMQSVGLRDNQVKDLAELLSKYGNDYAHMVTVLRQWLENQSFSKLDLAEDYMELKAEVRELRKFQDIDWDSMPEVNRVAIVQTYYGEGGVVLSSDVVYKDRPVERGQIWEHLRKGSRYEILGYIRTWVNDAWVDYVKYEELGGNAEYSRPESDFAVKFKRVW